MKIAFKFLSTLWCIKPNNTYQTYVQIEYTGTTSQNNQHA